MPLKELRIADLDPVYRTVGYEEAVEMANLGAAAYGIVRDSLRSEWDAAMGAEEAAKADSWRAEGRMSAIEEWTTKLKEMEGLSVRLAAAEATAEHLRTSVDTEVQRRVSEQLDGFRKDYELAKKDQLHALEKQLTEARTREQMSRVIERSNETLTEYVSQLQGELVKFKATKSSHAIGKIGEAMVLDMLNTYVLPRFPYSEVKDMTAVSHCADFHIFLMGPSGKRVKLLLDSKKYASPIQTIEVEKLYSDVDADDEADAGVMVSLDTPICTKSQFQIVKSKRNKPCLFLSFENLDDGVRKEVLCWGIRVLVSIVCMQDRTKQDRMVQDIQYFLSDLNQSINDLEACVKSSKGLYEMVRESKERLVGRINAYRLSSGMEEVTAETTTASALNDMQCKAKKNNGERCKSRRLPTSNTCVRHAAQEESA
jgi:hypothetical protein